jgi:hypothetical protein
MKTPEVQVFKKRRLKKENNAQEPYINFSPLDFCLES